MPESTPSRPRLVSVGDDQGTSPQPARPGSTASGARNVPRRVFWLVAALALATVIGLFSQAQAVRKLERENAALTGELFTARAALAAYAERFAAVRESVAGLTLELERLGALTNEDPVTGELPVPAPADPEAPGS